MLDAGQKKLLEQLLSGLSQEQKIWLTGYLNGLTAGQGGDVQPGVSIVLPVYYATETGNTKSVAQALEKQARSRGYKTRLIPLGRIKPEEFNTLSGPAIFLSSTHGEGDPPDMAKKFFAALAGASLSCEKLEYAMLGLGDHAYAQFCGAAVTLEEALKKGGAKAFHPTALYDVDFTEHTPGWIEDVLNALAKITGAPVRAPAAPRTQAADGRGFSRLAPVKGTVKDSVNLNDIGSNKETYHIEIAFEDALAYAPGDAAGIILPAEPDGNALVPRLYSIASSSALYPQEVHLTVALATYALPDGTPGFGLASRYLADLKPGDAVEFYIQRNLRFKLPEDSTDIIMIGPGTGIAPFRAFVQERSERGATGRNWLFFGEQYQHCDFLYQLEWQEFLGNGSLSRIDLAFSRDQEQKVYVQDRLQERGNELLDWIDGGARIYVCGRKDPMSADVENALLKLLATRHADAEDALARLAEEDRYVKDVY